jgi:hypothetical protein
MRLLLNSIKSKNITNFTKVTKSLASITNQCVLEWKPMIWFSRKKIVQSNMSGTSLISNKIGVSTSTAYF